MNEFLVKPVVIDQKWKYRVRPLFAMWSLLLVGCTDSTTGSVVANDAPNDTLAAELASDEESATAGEVPSRPVPPASGETQLRIQHDDLGTVGPGDLIVDIGCAPNNRHLVLAVNRFESPGYIEVTVDGVPQTFDDFRVGSITFSPTGERYAYVVIDIAGHIEDIKFQPVIDGVLGEAYDAIHYVVFSPDDQHAAFVYLDEGIENRKLTSSLIVDGQDQTPQGYNIVLPETIVFSPNGQRLAYIATQDGQSALFVDGIEQLHNSPHWRVSTVSTSIQPGQ